MNGLFYYLVFQFFCHIFNWEAFSVIVLAITAVVLYRQVKETRKSTKFLEYQTRLIAWFFLMSKKTAQLDKDNIVVKSESNSKIFLYYKIRYSLDNRGKTLPNNDPWDNQGSPLHIYPTLYNNFPDILHLDQQTELIKRAKVQDQNIRADIWYGLAPDFAPNKIQEKSPETWRFNLKNETWSGPNGAPDIGFLNLWKIRIPAK